MSGSDATPRALVALTKARKMLAEAKTIEQILAVENLAQRARDFAKAAGLGRLAVNAAVRIMLDCRRKAGDTTEAMRARGELAGQGRPKKRNPAETFFTVDDIGLTKKQAARYVQEASVPEDAYALWWEEVDGNDDIHASAAGLRTRWRQLGSEKNAQTSGSVLDSPETANGDMPLQMAIDQIRKTVFSAWEKCSACARVALPNVLRSIADELEHTGMDDHG